MSLSFFFGISITLLVSILTVQSVYNPYLYDDGHGGEEHCCIVRVHENFCMATPLTRSLIQVNKQCSRFRKSKSRRSGRRNGNNAYLDQISRRLNVQNIHEDGEKIFIELQKPLEKNILQNDLICLTSTNKDINLEQCYVDAADDLYNEHEPQKEHRRRKDRAPKQNFDQIKRSILKSEEDDDTSEENEAEKEIYRIEISQTIRVHEREGLSFIKQHQIDASHIRPTTPEQRRCWSWYRNQVRKLHRNRSKSSQLCLPLNNAREDCINQLIHNTFNQTGEKQSAKVSFAVGSKLFCKNQDNHDNFLGYYQDGMICFDRDDQIHLEYKFSDIARLSDPYKNKDALKFIAQDKKLTAELQDDCHDQTNLVEKITTTETISNKTSKKN